MLLESGYNVLSAEVILLTGVAALFGIGFGLLLCKVRSLFWIFFSLLFCAFLDAYFIGPRELTGIELALLLYGILAVLFLFEKQVLPVVTVFVVFFSVSALFVPPIHNKSFVADQNQQDRAAALVAKPKLLHIVLDEMGSPDAMSGSIAEGHPADDILDDLVARGFEVRTQAETVSPRTKGSMGAIADLSLDETNFVELGAGDKFLHRVKSNRLHKGFVNSGYDVSVIQTDFIDYCHGIDELTCETYSSFGDNSVFYDEPFWLRLQIAGIALHQKLAFGGRSEVKLYRSAAFVYFTLSDAERLQFHNFAEPKTVKRVMDAMPSRIKQMQNGDVLFVHLLLPHFPYVLDRECNLLPISKWGYSQQYYGSDPMDPVYYEAYWDQVACTYSLLAPTLDAAAEIEDLTVVIHGDHGPRLIWYKTKVNPLYMRQTILAIREPGRPQRLIRQPQILQSVIPIVMAPYLGEP